MGGRAGTWPARSLRTSSPQAPPPTPPSPRARRAGSRAVRRQEVQRDGASAPGLPGILESFFLSNGPLRLCARALDPGSGGSSSTPSWSGRACGSAPPSPSTSSAHLHAPACTRSPPPETANRPDPPAACISSSPARRGPAAVPSRRGGVPPPQGLGPSASPTAQLTRPRRAGVARGWLTVCGPSPIRSSNRQ